MTQYIDKAALIAEIEKKKISFTKDIDDGVYPTYLCALMDFEDLINSLEVKDVDLNATNEQKQLNKQTHKAIDAVFENYERLYGNQNRIQL